MNKAMIRRSPGSQIVQGPVEKGDVTRAMAKSRTAIAAREGEGSMLRVSGPI